MSMFLLTDIDVTGRYEKENAFVYLFEIISIVIVSTLILERSCGLTLIVHEITDGKHIFLSGFHY